MLKIVCICHTQYFDIHSADVSAWAMGKLVSYRKQISRVMHGARFQQSQLRMLRNLFSMQLSIYDVIVMCVLYLTNAMHAPLAVFCLEIKNLLFHRFNPDSFSFHRFPRRFNSKPTQHFRKSVCLYLRKAIPLTLTSNEPISLHQIAILSSQRAREQAGSKSIPLWREQQKLDYEIGRMHRRRLWGKPLHVPPIIRETPMLSSVLITFCSHRNTFVAANNFDKSAPVGL